VVNPLWAGQAAIPNSFSTGQTLTAGALNGNFNELETEVNDNDDRITINAGNISTNTSNITNLQSSQAGGVIGTIPPTLLAFSSTITNIGTLTLPAPKAGVAIFTANGSMSLRSHQAGIESRAICSLATTNDSLVPPYASLVLPGSVPEFTTTLGFVVPFNLSRAITVTAPGDVTIFLNCQKFGGGTEDGYVQYVQTYVVFVPNEL
jgi:hypothetical protein